MGKMNELAMDAAEIFMERHPKVTYQIALDYVMSNKNLVYWQKYIKNKGSYTSYVSSEKRRTICP